MDAALAALLGALIGATGPFVSGELSHRRARVTELQRRRYDAYVNFLAAGYRARTGGESDALIDALAVVALLGSLQAVKTASMLLKAVMAHDDGQIGEQLANFTDMARHELGIVVHK